MTSGAGRPDYLLPVAGEQRGWTSFAKEKTTFHVPHGQVAGGFSPTPHTPAPRRELQLDIRYFLVSGMTLVK